MVQPILKGNWDIDFISDMNTKKVKNLQVNPNTWLIADATGIFHIPRVVYIKGKSSIDLLTEDKFEDFLNHHGPLSTRTFRGLVKDGLDTTAIVTIKPIKFITIGLFGSMNEQVSFVIR